MVKNPVLEKTLFAGYSTAILFPALAFLLYSCGTATDPASRTNAADTVAFAEAQTPPVTSAPPPEASSTSLARFVPEGYVLYEESGLENIAGDLNKDGLEDRVLLVKGTAKSKIVPVENRGVLDRNRRGIIILFNTGNGYEKVLQNLDCFSSENEEGGVYYAPELYPEIKKGNLYIQYLHGRYGYWTYTFRYQNGDFELIGYDESNHRGPIVESDLSVNFSTGKLIQRENINEEIEEGGDEVFKETEHHIRKEPLLKLSGIKEFDDLRITELYSVL